MDPVAPMAPEGGNTITPSPLIKSDKKRISAAKKWAFTWNNYPENWLALLAPVLEDQEWIAGYEIGESGTPHIQGFVEFTSKVRPVGYKGAPKAIHWEICKGDRASNVKYCSKDGNVVKESTIKVPRTIKFPEMDLWWEKELLEIIETEPDDRTIYWYWSDAGNLGKTTFTKYLCVKHEACLLSGKGADVRNGAMTWKKDKGSYPNLCVFPIPRSFNSDYLSYEAIENVKDACFYSGKYEGGTVCDPCPHLLVLANFPPDESKMSYDRWVVKNVDPENPDFTPPAASASLGGQGIGDSGIL